MQEKYEYVVEHVQRNVVDKKHPYDTDIDENEKRFIAAMVMACDERNLVRNLYFLRLANGDLEAWCNCFVGRINLRGNRTYMQILLPDNGVDCIENKDLDLYIKAIQKWIKYIEFCNQPLF